MHTEYNMLIRFKRIYFAIYYNIFKNSFVLHIDLELRYPLKNKKRNCYVTLDTFKIISFIAW